MIQIFKTIDDKLTKLDEVCDGAWINIVSPKEEEVNRISKYLDIDLNHIRAALDEEERSRIEVDEDGIVIIIDVPIKQENEDDGLYTTIPLGIVLTKDYIITVCTKEIPLINGFILGNIKTFYTFKKTRFILQILYKNATYYLQYLKHLNRRSNDIEKTLHKSMKNKELIQLLEIEKSLVYFSVSLKGNEAVLERMLRIEAIKKYPEDTELLEDVIIENKQAIEMTKTYTDILNGVMEAFASIISNNLNIAMKFLTSISIVMGIPTVIASIFGMNVIMPLSISDSPDAFLIIILVSLGISIISAIIMAKKKLF